MTSQTTTALETQLTMLDPNTAQRVTRLVFECSASLDLALMAVQEADRSIHKEERQSRPRCTVAGVLAALWVRSLTDRAHKKQQLIAIR